MFKQIIIGGVLVASQFCQAQSSNYDQIFLEFWTDYNNNYAYFEKQGVDWNKVKEIYLTLVK